MYQIYEGKDKMQLQEVGSYDYWNNEEEETKKAWDIRDKNFDKLEKLILDSGLKNDLEKALKLSTLSGQRNLQGIELGGGYVGVRPFCLII